MKTAAQIIKEKKSDDRNYEVVSSTSFALKDEVLQDAINEFADQFKSDKLFEFVYNCMTEESSYATISLHRTREGAEKAKNEHKEKCREEWMKEYPVGSYQPYPFGKFEDWDVQEVEILD